MQSNGLQNVFDRKLTLWQNRYKPDIEGSNFYKITSQGKN